MKHTKKIVFLFIFAVVFCSFSFSAELEYINYEKINKLDAYRNDLVFAQNHQSYFEVYVPDDYWVFNYTRAECVEKLTKLYNELVQNEEPDNIEYLLLKGSIATYLYNLDETSFFKVAETIFKDIGTKFSFDYRAPWFLGKFYVNSILIEEGLNQFKLVLQTVVKEDIEPEFFYNYGSALYIAGMPMSALNAYNLYEKYSGKSLQNNSLYNVIQNLAHEYDGTDTESDMLMNVQHREGFTDILLRPFGLGFSIPEDWTINAASFVEKMFGLYAYLKSSSDDGDEINYSVLLLSSVGDTAEETQAFNQFIPCFDMFPNVEMVDLFPGRNDIITLEYSDPDEYADRGGSHGYAVLVTEPWTETADMNMEVFVDYFNKSEGGVKYYAPKEFYKRYEGYAVHFFLLDSCEAIFDESKKQFVDFINNCWFY